MHSALDFKANHLLKSLFRGVLGLGLLYPIQAIAATDVTEFSLEELMGMEITSVAKKSQPLSEAAAAIYVITREHIRRSGMTSIPELLRMVPGLQVAHIDSNKWAISSRGFNGRWSNKLLVLMDGRTLYNPMFSGVYWDVQGTIIEDIERIEVIRGSGGAIWGANAMNGVINIITRHSRDTQSGFVSVRSGEHEQGARVRFGSNIGENGTFRAYATTDDFDEFADSGETSAYDAWEIQRIGLRTDWALDTDSELTIQADAYKGDMKQMLGNLESAFSSPQFLPTDSQLDGNNLLFRWNSNLKNNSSWSFQGYFDRAERSNTYISELIDTYDFEFQYNFSIDNIHQINWGVSARRINDKIIGDFTVSFDPFSEQQNLYTAFIQDDISLNDELSLTIGSKFEHTSTIKKDIEVQPSVRMLWRLDDTSSLWAAVGRSITAPSRVYRDITINVAAFASPFVDPDGPGPLPTGAPIVISIVGDNEVDSEVVKSVELGYRSHLSENVSFDSTLFYNSYDRLHSTEQSFAYGGSPAPTHLIMLRTFDNQMRGKTFGIELSAKWQVSTDWRIDGSYSWINIDTNLLPNSTDVNSVDDTELVTPEHQLQLHAYWDISDMLQLDVAAYYVDEIRVRGVNERKVIADYTRLDIRLGWHLSKTIEVNLVGQNLLEKQHVEFVSSDSLGTEVPRSIYLQIKKLF